MKKYLLIFGVGFLLLSCQEKTEKQTQSNQDTPTVAILPPKEIFLEDLLEIPSADSLENYFGKENVQYKTLSFSEEEDILGTVLFPESPKEIFITWVDTVGAKVVRQIIANATYENDSTIQKNDFIKTKIGLTLGMTLSEVQSLNGRVFSLYGTGWEMGGTVENWKGGTLNGFSVVFSPMRSYVNLSKTESNAVLGDQIVLSDNPAWQKLEMRVSQIILIKK